MTTPLVHDKSGIHERAVSEAEGEQIADAFDNGFEAGQDDWNVGPISTPNPHVKGTVLFHVWALGYELGADGNLTSH